MAKRWRCPARQLRRIVACHGMNACGSAAMCSARLAAARHSQCTRFFIHGAAQRHIGRDGVVEHHHVLAHHGKLAAQGEARFQVLSSCRRSVIWPWLLLTKRGSRLTRVVLPAPGGAHQRHDLARCHTQADVVERWRLLCAERDAGPVQHNLPAPGRQVRAFRLCPGVTQVTINRVPAQQRHA